MVRFSFQGIKRKKLRRPLLGDARGYKSKTFYTEDDTKNLNHEIGLPGYHLLLEGLEQLCIPIDLDN